jgi:hypothetical protein
MFPSIEYRLAQQTEWRNDASTSFGRLVYNAQLKIANAFSHSSELRMIDAIKSHSGMSIDQQKIIIDKLLDDSQLENLVA